MSGEYHKPDMVIIDDPALRAHDEQIIALDRALLRGQHLSICPSGQCDRLVRWGSYCCAPCRMAWEANPRYEPHAHSPGCDERQAARVR